MNDDIGMTDMQFKNELRHQKIMLQEILNLAKQNEIELLLQKIDVEIKRIDESLQD